MSLHTHTNVTAIPEHTLEYPAPKANWRGLELIPRHTSPLILGQVTSTICFSSPWLHHSVSLQCCHITCQTSQRRKGTRSPPGVTHLPLDQHILPSWEIYFLNTWVYKTLQTQAISEADTTSAPHPNTLSCHMVCNCPTCTDCSLFHMGSLPCDTPPKEDN